ncbi:MAG: hypothetical protein QOK05_641 [Chloroflexota bacterium]|nr:hypothetical protein [Chloroflexota bacterium]
MTELRARGHIAIAVDLPAGDPDAGAAEYATVIADSLAHAAEPVIVVGHSMGGLTIPLVPALRPVRSLVFICGAIPEPGRSHMQVKAEEPGEGVAGQSVWEQPGDWHLTPRELARELFYNDCPPALQEWALDRMRPQYRKPLREVTPLQQWPSLPVTLINATDDRCISLESARATGQRIFGVDPIEVPGGHLPFLANPGVVADQLDEIAR